MHARMAGRAVKLYFFSFVVKKPAITCMPVLSSNQVWFAIYFTVLYACSGYILVVLEHMKTYCLPRTYLECTSIPPLLSVTKKECVLVSFLESDKYVK
jgi:hypothetical protein